MKKTLPLILLLFLACQNEQKSVIDYVNPFIVRASSLQQKNLANRTVEAQISKRVYVSA